MITKTVKRADFQRVTSPDFDPDISYLTDESRYAGLSVGDEITYRQYDQERLDAYNRDEWSLIGIRAQVEIAIPLRESGVCVIQEIISPGLWGIESDSDAAYLDDVYAQECDILTDMLTALGYEVVREEEEV